MGVRIQSIRKAEGKEIQMGIAFFGKVVSQLTGTWSASGVGAVLGSIVSLPILVSKYAHFIIQKPHPANAGCFFIL